MDWLNYLLSLWYRYNCNWPALCLMSDPIDPRSTVSPPIRWANWCPTNGIYMRNISMEIRNRTFVRNPFFRWLHQNSHRLPGSASLFQQTLCETWISMSKFHFDIPMTTWLSPVFGLSATSPQTHDFPVNDSVPRNYFQCFIGHHNKTIV